MTFSGYLTARTFSEGRAIRIANYRHRRINRKPLMLVFLTLGAQPFSMAAVAWGSAPEDFNFAVAGDPRNPSLLLNLLGQLTEALNPDLEANPVNELPQVIVPNRASVEVLSQIARRCLASQSWISPEIYRFGQYLRVLTDRESFPGQQLLMPVSDLINGHNGFPLPKDATENLLILNSYVDPMSGLDGFETFEALEQAGNTFVSPHPSVQEDGPLVPLLEEFNELRGDSTDLSAIKPLLQPIEAHYEPLLRKTWDLSWRCVNRECDYPEADFVERRWQEDIRYYQAQLNHIQSGGRFSARATPKAASAEFIHKEAAAALVEAEEAIADPLKMLPFFDKDQAVLGEVVSIDLEHRRSVRGRNVRRPRLVLALNIVCRMPPGTKLWWTGYPKGKPWVLEEFIPPTVPEELYRFVLVHESDRLATPRPETGQTATFSVLNLDNQYQMRLPQETPWTHQPGGMNDV